MTDFKTNQIIEALKGIEHELKHISEELHEYNKQQARKQQPPADPMGYTE